MKKTTEEIEALLGEDIPKSAVSLREGGGGQKLRYVAGHYVINRLNEIFGPLAWASNTIEMRLVHAGEYNGKFSVHYVATVRLIISAMDGISHIGTGYGDGSDKNPGKAHELAVKEAETDALKRAAKNLGLSMGLALYDKEYVPPDDEKPKELSEVDILQLENLFDRCDTLNKAALFWSKQIVPVWDMLPKANQDRFNAAKEKMKEVLK